MPNDDSSPKSGGLQTTVGHPDTFVAQGLTSACFLKLDVIFRWDLIFRLSHLLFRLGLIA